MVARAVDRHCGRMARADRARGGTNDSPAGARRSTRARDRELHSRPRRPHASRPGRTGPVSLPGHASRGVEPEQFRQLLGRFATGVTVLTSRSAKGQPVGMTASSVASVSLDPPLVLVSVEKVHDMHAALESGTHFVLNILSAEQEALSRRFAGVETDRFRGVSYRENERGIAVIDGVVAHIECEKRSAVPGGDHTVFIGLVVGGDATDRRPLLYYRGGYAGLSR